MVWNIIPGGCILGKNYDKSVEIRKAYTEWKNLQQQSNQGFFPVFKDFMGFLPSLSGGACLLYIYLGLNSKYKTGELFHDVNRMATFFQRSTRTIRQWISELEEKKLIHRMQVKYNGVTYTYLLPYGVNSAEINERMEKAISDIDADTNYPELD